MPYQIQPYTLQKADRYHLVVKPSQRRGFKIDVYNPTGLYLFSGGALGYPDYPTYIMSHGLTYANERQRLYHLRHKYQNGTRGWLIGQLLW